MEVGLTSIFNASSALSLLVLYYSTHKRYSSTILYSWCFERSPPHDRFSRGIFAQKERQAFCAGDVQYLHILVLATQLELSLRLLNGKARGQKISKKISIMQVLYPKYTRYSIQGDSFGLYHYSAHALPKVDIAA